MAWTNTCPINCDIYFLAKRYISLGLPLYKRKGLVIRAKGFYSNNK